MPPWIAEVAAALKIEPGSIVTMIASSIAKIGDKKARMQAVEVAALTAAHYNRAILDRLEGKGDETAMLAKDALLDANMFALGLLAKTVDLDNSINGGQG